MINLSDTEREAYAVLADFLIPEYNGKPSASSVGTHKEMLDEVMRIRPDLKEGFLKALRYCEGKTPSEGLNALRAEDQSSFDALTAVTTGGYMMTDEARAAIGYPGQEAATYDITEMPEYHTNGMLERVVRRGPIYRDTRHLK